MALAITGVALAAGLRAAGSSTDNAQRLADVTAAQWCAENELTGIRLTKDFPGVGDDPFECTQLGRTYKGTLSVRPTPNPNFRRVDARIADEQGRPVLALSTVVGRY